MAYNRKFFSFKQYLPLKLVSHKIKIWCLAYSVSKFMLNFEVYIGSANECIQGLPFHACGSSVGVVTHLTHGWENKWYTVVMDNFFTLPLLFDDLIRRGFYAIETARQKKIGFPSSMKIPDKGTRGALHIRMHRDKHLVATHWLDTKGVFFLSTSTNPI